MKTAALALALCLVAAAAVAQETSPEDKRRLVEQKMRLVEMLVRTQATKSLASGSAPSERLDQGTAAIIQARQALQENRIDDAGRILDGALRSTSAGQAGAAAPGLNEEAQRRTYQNLVEQVATYRASVEELAAHPRLGRAARELLTRIDGKSAEARRQATGGSLEAANRTLGEAYQLAVGELSRLRAGDEVVLSLKFASPAEEFAYEVKRYESNQILVNMMVSDGKAEGERQALVNGFAGEARRLRGEADGLARSGRHREAIPLMESAVGQLNRALQAMGVPVF